MALIFYRTGDTGMGDWSFTLRE